MEKIFNEETENLLAKLEETASEFWNISRKSANFLNMLVKISGAKSVVEVGTSNGYSGIWLAKALKETGGKLTTIEFWPKRIVLAEENFKMAEVDDIIEIKQGEAIKVLEEIDFEIDLAFIDANKSEYIDYYRLVDRHLKKGGIITCDNITSHASKVQDFVDTIKSDKNYQVEIIDLPGGMLMAYKLN